MTTENKYNFCTVFTLCTLPDQRECRFYKAGEDKSCKYRENTTKWCSNIDACLEACEFEVAELKFKKEVRDKKEK